MLVIMMGDTFIKENFTFKDSMRLQHVLWALLGDPL